jgi:hypothetical protein
VNGQSLENPFTQSFRISGAILILMVAVSLCFVVPPLMVIAPFAGATLLWVVFHYPVTTLGAILAFIPVDYMAIELGKFFGLPHMTVVSVFDKEVPLLLIALVLWRRNGFKPLAPDWFLLGCFAIAAVHTVFDGTLFALWTDFNFILPYLVGRVLILSEKQELLWARCAVWITAVLSLLGLFEVFILGEGPRTILYLATDAETEGGALTSSFHGTGFTGLREAATMVGPNGFGALCMIALIVWWVYCRNPLPAGMIAVGLICSLTRSAWLGAAGAIPVLAVVMGQKKRLSVYAALALALLLASIPVLDLSDYLFSTKTGQDPSAESHQHEIVAGVEYAVEHPLGSGNSRLNPTAFKQDGSVIGFETTYPELAAEYGIVAALCFVGFLLSALYLVWQKRSQLGYVAVGLLVGVGLVMVVTLPLTDRRLACWALFPIGLAIRAVREGSGVPFRPPVISEQS